MYQRFCLTLLGEARLWYATLNPDAIYWPALHLGNSTQNWAIPQSNTSTNGEALILMKMWTILTHMSQGLINVP